MIGPPVARAAGRAASRLVEGWWSSRSTGSATIVPDGATDLIFVEGAEPFLAGPDTVPHTSLLAPGAEVVGLRLRPGVAIAAFGSPIVEYADRRVPLDAVWAGETTRWLAANLESTSDAHERAAVLIEALSQHVPADWVVDPLVAEAARLLRGGQNLTTLSPSSRQVRRRFTDSMGYGPKFYERICRLDRFTDLLATHPASTTIAELAATAGYHDQAHLARDCTAFTGRTPGQLRRNP